jgi:transposase
MALFWLSDRQFGVLKPLLPTDTRGVPRVDDRRVISGIIFVLMSGCRWKDAPAAYGPHKTLYNRFVRWAGKGVWDHIFVALSGAGGPPATVMIDATHAKAHRSAAGGKGGPTVRPSGARVVGARPKSTSRSTDAAARDG